MAPFAADIIGAIICLGNLLWAWPAIAAPDRGNPALSSLVHTKTLIIRIFM
jgi:hypothetical protein